MKAVVIATDYVKDINGEFKVLEMNTQTALLFKDATKYLDLDGLEQLVSDNGITNIELILPQVTGTTVIDTEYTETGSLGKSIEGAIRMQYESSSVNIEAHYTSNTSTTIPFIEDNDTTLIIRVSYDSTALIDSVYCADNFEFLKLMYDANPTSIPSTYINHTDLGFDTIGDTIRDNGEYPNYIIKERFPTTNYQQYPKIIKINNLDELNSIKSNLLPNTLLQEYVFNPTDVFEGKLKTYRVVSMVYGSELDILDLTHPFEHTNGCAFGETVDFDTNGELAIWERPCYIQKYLSSIEERNRFRYQFDDASKIFMPDGSISTVQNIQSGSVLKSLNFDGMPLDELLSGSQNWSSSFSELTNGLEVTTTTVGEYSSTNKSVWIINLELSNDSKFADIEYARLLSKTGTQTEYKFNRFFDVNIGDYIILFNNETNSIQEVSVTNIEYSYETIDIFSVDVEPIDVLLTSEEGVESPIYAIYQHNPPADCNRVCCSNSWPVSTYQQCPSGGSGWCYYWPYTYDVCVDGPYYPGNCYGCLSACFGDNCGTVPK
jgi:hypothetical protein